MNEKTHESLHDKYPGELVIKFEYIFDMNNPESKVLRFESHMTEAFIEDGIDVKAVLRDVMDKAFDNLMERRKQFRE